MEVLCFVLPWLFIAGLYGYVVLAPLLDPQVDARRPPVFFLSDVVWLGLLLQAPLAFLAAAAHWCPLGLLATAGGLLVMVVLAAWWRSATALSRRGIYGASRRAVYLLIVMPTAVLGGVFLAPLGIGLLLLVVEDNPDDSLLFRVGALGAFVLPFLAAFVARYLCRWVMRGAAQLRRCEQRLTRDALDLTDEESDEGG